MTKFIKKHLSISQVIVYGRLTLANIKIAIPVMQAHFIVKVSSVILPQSMLGLRLVADFVLNL